MKIPEIPQIRQAGSFLHKRIRTELTSAFILSTTAAELAYAAKAEPVNQDKFVQTTELTEAEDYDNLTSFNLFKKTRLSKNQINHYINSI